MTNPSVFRLALGMVALALVLGGPQARGDLVTVTESVEGQSGPWLFANGGLNTGAQYGVDDQTPPTIFGLGQGLLFVPGETVEVAYVAGLTNAYGGPPEVDASGYANYEFNDGPGSSGRGAPSFFMDPADFPINLNALVGAFADEFGAIVGAPFSVGLGRTVTVPSGAARLQLGINDDIYGDNTGFLTVNVTAQAVPEPASLVLMASGLLGLFAALRRRKPRGPATASV